MTGLLDMGLIATIGPGGIAAYWFALPLVVAMSLVYSASRHESWPRIVKQSARLTAMILTILVVATALLLIFNTQV